MKEVPDNYIRPSIYDSIAIRETEIVPKAYEKLRYHKEVSYFSCHNFWGNIWWDGKFNCEVWIRMIHVDTVEADTLEELVEKCRKYIEHEEISD